MVLNINIKQNTNNKSHLIYTKLENPHPPQFGLDLKF